MDAAAKDPKTAAKLFAGIIITSELQMHLNASKAWQNALLDSSADLIKARYEDSDYLGFYLSEQKLCLSELARYEQLIRDRLKNYCPKLDNTHLKCVVFSQIFIY